MTKFMLKVMDYFIKEQQDNFVFSPFSYYIATTMAYIGSTGKTKKEFEKFFDGDKGFKERVISLSEELKKFISHDVLKINNSIWIRDSIIINHKYKKINERYLNSEIFNVDFASPKTIKDMSDWVNEKANRLLNYTPNLSHDTLMVLINTIYFKDKWKIEPSDKWKIEPWDKFTSFRFEPLNSESGFVDGFIIKVFEHEILYASDYTMSFLEYKSGFKMYFIKPDNYLKFAKQGKIRDVLQNINNKHNYVQQDISFYVPNFEIKSNFDFKNISKELNLKTPFDSKKAELLNFIEPNDGNTYRNHYIDKIEQQSFIKVNSEGTEAAAATITEEFNCFKSDELEKFKLDSPFIYILKGDDDVILFVGSVLNIPES